VREKERGCEVMEINSKKGREKGNGKRGGKREREREREIVEKKGYRNKKRVKDKEEGYNMREGV